MLKQILNENIWIIVALIFLGGAAYILWPKKTDTKQKGVLVTEQSLLKQNQDLINVVLQEKDKRISELQARNAMLEDRLSKNTQAATTIKKNGDEKINSISSYNTDSVLRYISSLKAGDSTTTH